MLTTAPRGTADILPDSVAKFQHVEKVFREICHRAYFQEIRTPMFEHSELFNRAVGEQTDIVQKEMYTFPDRSQRSLTLRPEGTAPVVRAFIEKGVYAKALPAKYYYIAQIFRYEKPGQVRLRQHQQCGIEYFGSSHSLADVEVISLACRFYRGLGLKEFDVLINTIGCPQCRPRYREALIEFLAGRVDKLCDDCRRRYQRNPLRVLDCKQESCQREIVGAPTPIEYACESCLEHYRGVKEGLNTLGIAYIENPRLVRGLDYYTHTAFEFHSSHIGSQGAIGGGGRYDALVEECGGPSTPGVGFGIGTERLIYALEQEGVVLPSALSVDVFLATLGRAAEAKALTLLKELRQEGLVAEVDLMGRSLKAQMKQAARLGSRYVVVMGDAELAQGQAPVRHMEDGEQVDVELDELVAYLTSR